MRILNIVCISKEKAGRYYVDLIVKVFEENSEIIREGGIECQLGTCKSGRSSDQNFMFVERGKRGVRILDFFADFINELLLTEFLFAIKYDFFSFSLLSLVLQSYFHCFAC